MISISRKVKDPNTLETTPNRKIQNGNPVLSLSRQMSCTNRFIALESYNSDESVYTS